MDFCDFGIHWLRLRFLPLLISSEMRGKSTVQGDIFYGTTHLSIYRRRTDRFALCCPGRRPETEEFCRAFWRRPIRWTCHTHTCRDNGRKDIRKHRSSLHDRCSVGFSRIRLHHVPPLDAISLAGTSGDRGHACCLAVNLFGVVDWDFEIGEHASLLTFVRAPKDQMVRVPGALRFRRDDHRFCWTYRQAIWPSPGRAFPRISRHLSRQCHSGRKTRTREKEESWNCKNSSREASRRIGCLRSGTWLRRVVFLRRGRLAIPART